MSRADRKLRRRIKFIGDAPGGNYTEKIVNLPSVTGVRDIDVFHDEWCALLTKRLACNCSPDVKVRT